MIANNFVHRNTDRKGNSFLNCYTVNFFVIELADLGLDYSSTELMQSRQRRRCLYFVTKKEFTTKIYKLNT